MSAKALAPARTRRKVRFLHTAERSVVASTQAPCRRGPVLRQVRTRSHPHPMQIPRSSPDERCESRGIRGADLRPDQRGLTS